MTSSACPWRRWEATRCSSGRLTTSRSDSIEVRPICSTPMATCLPPFLIPRPASLAMKVSALLLPRWGAVACSSALLRTAPVDTPLPERRFSSAPMGSCSPLSPILVRRQLTSSAGPCRQSGATACWLAQSTLAPAVERRFCSTPTAPCSPPSPIPLLRQTSPIGSAIPCRQSGATACSLARQGTASARR